MGNILVALADLATVFLVYLFLNRYFSTRKRSPSVCFFAFALYAVGLWWWNHLPDAAFLRLLYNTGCIILMGVFLYGAKPLFSIYAGVSLSGIFVLADVLVMGIWILVGVDPWIMLEESMMRGVYMISSEFIYFTLIQIVLALSHKTRTSMTFPLISTVLPSCAVNIFLGCYFGKQVALGRVADPIPIIIAAFGLLYMDICVVFFADRTAENYQKQKDLALAEQHYAMQERYYEKLRCEQNETRAMFHDIGKYMSAMQALACGAPSGETSQIMEEVQSLFDELDQVVDVGNSVLNILLTEYREEARNEDIDFTFDVCIPPHIPLTASDVYILLGNTLDNAIDTCIALPSDKRYIRLELKQHKNMLLYYIENPYDPEYAIERSKSKYHGYGLKNVARCIEKHQGDMMVTQKDGVFMVTARIRSSVQEAPASPSN